MAAATRTLEGDYASAWRRVTQALASIPNLTVDGQAPEGGVIRATRRRMLGRVDVRVALVETETGEVEVHIEATGSGLRADPEEIVAAIAVALPYR